MTELDVDVTTWQFEDVPAVTVEGETDPITRELRIRARAYFERTGSMTLEGIERAGAERIHELVRDQVRSIQDDAFQRLGLQARLDEAMRDDRAAVRKVLRHLTMQAEMAMAESKAQPDDELGKVDAIGNRVEARALRRAVAMIEEAMK